jgi:exopolyphosphatase/pppGpp-phosphohydrolase
VNGEELRRRLELAAGFPARVLSAVEEGRLAFVGAVALASPPSGRTVAVVDVGRGRADRRRDATRGRGLGKLD